MGSILHGNIFHWLISSGALPKSKSLVGWKYQFFNECMFWIFILYHINLEIKDKQNSNLVRALIRIRPMFYGSITKSQYQWYT